MAVSSAVGPVVAEAVERRAIARTLGALAHYDAHWRRRRRPVDLPDITSTSVITPGTARHRTGTYPPANLVNAIDARMGRAGWQARDMEAEGKLSAALTVLNAYNPILTETVRLVCLQGRARFVENGSVRHFGPIYEAALAAEPFEDDTRKLQLWLGHAWDFLGALMAPPDELAGHLGEPDTERAVRLLRARGLLRG